MANTSTRDSEHSSALEESPPPSAVQYRLYKRRFAGLLGLVVLAIVTGMPWVWFGPISTQTATEFDLTVDQVNWLSIIVDCLPTSLLVPIFCSRFGISRCAQFGVLVTFISAWVRYAGNSTSLSSESAYVLLMFGQVLSAIAQPVFFVLGPMYSERWFDLKGRTTATMIVAISNPVGSALGQLLSPLFETTRQSILILAIISTAVTPVVLFVSSAPPTPPTYSGSKPPQTLTSLCRAILGWPVPPEAHMTFRERIDFVILTVLFGVFVAAPNALGVLSAEWFEPMGYSDTTAGLMGASLLLSGVAASVIAAPLLDRVFTHRLGVTLKVLVPIVAASWFSLIWAVRPNNTAALFAIFAVIGICSLTMLPVGLELGVELTRNADASAAILFCSGNLFGAIFILGEGALRASSTADPPYNMNNALILQGTLIMVFGTIVFFVRARQARRELDETMAAENAIPMVSNPKSAEKLETS